MAIKLKCQNIQCNGSLLKFKDWDEFMNKVDIYELDFDPKENTLIMSCSRCKEATTFSMVNPFNLKDMRKRRKQFLLQRVY